MSISPLINRRDLDFLVFDWLQAERLCERPRHAEHNRATLSAAIDTAEAVARDRFAPLNRLCDEHEPRFDGEDPGGEFHRAGAGAEVPQGPLRRGHRDVAEFGGERPGLDPVHLPRGEAVGVDVAEPFGGEAGAAEDAGGLGGGGHVVAPGYRWSDGDEG